MPSLIPTPKELDALIRAEVAEARRAGDADGADAAALWAVLARAWDGALRPLLAAGLMDTLDRDGDGVITEEELDAAREVLMTVITVQFVGAALGAFAAHLARSYEAARTAALQADAVQAWLALAQRAAVAPPAGGPPAPPGPTLPAGPGGVRTILRLGGPDERAIAWLQRHQVYWVKDYGVRHVHGRIAEVAEKILREGLSRDHAAREMQAAMGGVYERGLSYWKLVASAAVQRSRELGRLSAYERAGVTEVYVDAVHDRRTSDICEYLHPPGQRYGRRILVADLIRQRDALLAIDPGAPGAADRVVEVSPWLPLARVKALVEANGGDIPAALGAPPYHGFCRTVTVVRPPERRALPPAQDRRQLPAAS